MVVYKDAVAGNFWIWQGDGDDHVESLVCNVQIRPEQLQEILSQLTTLRAAAERARNELIDIGKFAAAHHSDEESCRWLHALTVDIPTMVENATGERITQRSEWEFPPAVCPHCGSSLSPEWDRSAILLFACGYQEDACNGAVASPCNTSALSTTPSERNHDGE
jgi:hypothetical protein